MILLCSSSQFFYFCFFICALLIFTAVWMFTFKESFESYIDRHWDVVADLLKTQIDTVGLLCLFSLGLGPDRCSVFLLVRQRMWRLSRLRL